jgi:hypothetical protein
MLLGGALNIDTEGIFFTDFFITYQVTRTQNTAIITSTDEPDTPELHDLWIDKSTGKLKQWDGSQWIIRANNITVIVGSTFGRHLLDFDFNDEWASQNKWVHKTQLKTFESLTRAQLPIIEYEPFLDRSAHSWIDQQHHILQKNGSTDHHLKQIMWKLLNNLECLKYMIFA